MKTEDVLSTFNPSLLSAFCKMIKGIKVELSEKGKNTYKDAGILKPGRWHFILEIHSDGSLTLCSQTHTVFSGLNVSDIIV